MREGKLNVKTLLKWLIVLCCILNYQFYYFFELHPDLLRYNSGNNKTIIAMICCLMFIIVLSFKRLYLMSKSIRRFLCFFFIDCIVVFIYSVVHYSASAYSIFSVSYFYLILLMVVPLCYIFVLDGSVQRFLDVIMYVTLIAMILLAVQSFVYNTTGAVFLKGYFQISPGSLRDGYLRMSVTALGPFVAIYAVYKALTNQKGKILLIFIFFFGLYSVIFVSRTRMLIIIVVLCSLIMYIREMRYFNKGNKVIIFIGLLCILICFLPQLNGFFDTFSVSNEETGSNTSIRFEAIAYYMSFILQKPLTGQGFINAANSDALYALLRGSGGHYFYDDIGAIGTASRFGIPGFIFQFALIPYFLKIIKTIDGKKEQTFLIGLLSYYLVSMISLSMFDTQRIIVLALIIAIFDSLYTLNVTDHYN